MDIPRPEEIRQRRQEDISAEIAQAARTVDEGSSYLEMAEKLAAGGLEPLRIAAAALALHYGGQEEDIPEIRQLPAVPAAGVRTGGRSGGYQKITINIGRSSRVAPNHIVGAITGRTRLSGRDIGKIEIFDD